MGTGTSNTAASGIHTDEVPSGLNNVATEAYGPCTGLCTMPSNLPQGSLAFRTFTCSSTQGVTPPCAKRNQETGHQAWFESCREEDGETHKSPVCELQNSNLNGYSMITVYGCLLGGSLLGEVLLEHAHELGLLLGSLEPSVSELGGGVDELEGDLLLYQHKTLFRHLSTYTRQCKLDQVCGSNGSSQVTTDAQHTRGERGRMTDQGAPGRLGDAGLPEGDDPLPDTSAATLDHDEVLHDGTVVGLYRYTTESDFEGNTTDMRTKKHTNIQKTWPQWSDNQEKNATYEATHGGDGLLGEIELGGGVLVLDGAIGLAGSIA
jgi:hypothetical protein